MGEHLKEFATLANKVSTAMRDTRADVLSSREHPLPAASRLRTKERLIINMSQCPVLHDRPA